MTSHVRGNRVCGTESGQSWSEKLDDRAHGSSLATTQNGAGPGAGGTGAGKKTRRNAKAFGARSLARASRPAGSVPAFRVRRRRRATMGPTVGWGEFCAPHLQRPHWAPSPRARGRSAGPHPEAGLAGALTVCPLPGRCHPVVVTGKRVALGDGGWGVYGGSGGLVSTPVDTHGAVVERPVRRTVGVRAGSGR